MPVLPLREGASWCGRCRHVIEDITDGNGRAMIRCGCGLRFAPVLRGRRLPRAEPERDAQTYRTIARGLGIRDADTRARNWDAAVRRWDPVRKRRVRIEQ